MNEPVSPTRIICFGNSITAAFGIDPYQGFAAVLQNRIDSLGLPYRILNAGISGETTSGGNERIDWLLREPFAMFILELGINDLFLGIPAKEAGRELRSIIKKVKAAEPKAPILLLEAGIHPELAGPVAVAYREMYARLADEEDLILLTDWLTPVWADPSLLLRDGVHPNAAGQARLAEPVWDKLRVLLGS